MIIINREEQISLALDNENPESIYVKSPASGSPEFPVVFEAFTDVNVVPEHEKVQLEQAILKLEGIII